MWKNMNYQVMMLYLLFGIDFFLIKKISLGPIRLFFSIGWLLCVGACLVVAID